jgi:hypothetical protein
VPPYVWFSLLCPRSVRVEYCSGLSAVDIFIPLGNDRGIGGGLQETVICLRQFRLRMTEWDS